MVSAGPVEEQMRLDGESESLALYPAFSVPSQRRCWALHHPLLADPGMGGDGALVFLAVFGWSRE